MDKNELDHAEPAEPTSNNAIEQMVLDEEGSPPSLTFQMLASQWVWQRTKSVSIPAEEQNAGRVVDYFYRMEFHITPRFFSDSNYLFLNTFSEFFLTKRPCSCSHGLCAFFFKLIFLKFFLF